MKPEIITEILDHGKDDWVDFAEVMSVVQSQTDLPEPAVAQLSVEVIGDMLARDLVQVGELERRDDRIRFSPWSGQADQIVERIQTDLARLGHRPGLGDVCWLSTV